MVDLRRGFLGIQLAAAQFCPFDFGLLTTELFQETAVFSTSGDVYVEAFITKLDFGMPLELTEAYFDLIWMVRSDGLSESVSSKWQIRVRHGTWFDLCDECVKVSGSMTWGYFIRKGYVDIKNTVNVLPLEVRLLVKSSAAGGDSAEIKIFNTTYMRFIPKMLGIIENPIEEP